MLSPAISLSAATDARMKQILSRKRDMDQADQALRRIQTTAKDIASFLVQCQRE